MDRFVMFILEDIPAHSAPAGAIGKRRLVSISVRIQTLLPMLSKTRNGLGVQDEEWVWKDPSSDLTPHEISWCATVFWCMVQLYSICCTPARLY